MGTREKTKTPVIELEKDKNDGEGYINRKDIDNTPFTVITISKGSFVALGKYRLTELYKTEKEAIDEALKVDWNRITQVILLLIEMNNNQKLITRK